jgi:glutamine synthetase
MPFLAEYIWLDVHDKFRSKIRVINDNEEITNWNYDGSSTGQADVDCSEIILKPCKVFNNPLFKNNHKLVVCSTYNIHDVPLNNNHRHQAELIFNSKLEESSSYELEANSTEPWFGLEQEYYMLDKHTENIIGFKPDIGISSTRIGKYYCNPIYQDKITTKIAEQHMLMCLEARIKISGINAEVSPSQWEFQIGPCVGINAGDDMICARYILEKIAATYDVIISYHPKLNKILSGSGMHTNFSTKKMRECNGIEEIYRVIENLKRNHKQDMEKYGKYNNLRLTGLHETANINDFTYGVSCRDASIRINYETYKNKCGYFEDRRPAANADPYLVTSSIFSVV